MEHQTEDFEDTGGALSLDRAIHAVRKRLRLVVALPIIAALTVAVIVSLMPNRYDASAIIQIDPRHKSITQVDPVVADLKGDQPSIESEVEIVRSRPIVLQVIETLNLRNDAEFLAPSLVSRFMRGLGLTSSDDSVVAASRRPPRPRDEIAEAVRPDPPGSSNPERDEVAAAFLDRLKVTRVRNTLLMDVRFSAGDAVKAARIANTIAETYLKDQLDAKTRAASTASALLESKLEEMRVKVAEAERKVEKWKADHGVIDSEGQILSEKQLARLMEQAVMARNATSEARARLEQVDKLARLGDNGTAIDEVLKSDIVRLLKEQLATVTRKAAELSSKYGPRHPEMVKIKAEVAQAAGALDAEIARHVANIKNEAEVAGERERQLAESLALLKRKQIETKDVGVELREFEREAATSKQLFEALLARYKQTAETQGFQLPDARIVEKADAPLHPASPKRKQLVAISAAGGLILAVALSMLLELLAPGIGRPEDVERALDVALLSSIPALSADGEPQPWPTKAIRMVVAEPTGGYADAVRGARRELDTRRASPASRVILVTSSLAGEGADVFASNLAHHYAMTGGRSLLIDGDFRLKTLTRQLAGQRHGGLLEQILSQRPIEEAILRDGLTGLHFLPSAGAGPLHISVPEALSSDAMAQAFAGLRQRFDTIIVHAPPLLPVIDARILSDQADQIVFAILWQKTPKLLAKRAMKLLGSNERKIAGVVLTDVAEEILDPVIGISALFARARGTSRFDTRGRSAA